MSGVAASVAASLGFGSHRRRRRPRSPGGEGEEEEERRVAGGDEVGAEEEEDDDDAGGSSGSGAGGGGGGPATKRRRRTSAGAVGTGGPRRFEDVKQEILESKGLVRRSQEEALLRASRSVERLIASQDSDLTVLRIHTYTTRPSDRSNSGKWQRLVEAATLGGGTLASLGMARKATGASTTFLALSTLAISYLLRGAVVHAFH